MSETDWRLQTERRMNALETRTAVDEVHRAVVEKRLYAIEDMLKWLVRLVFGALLLGLLAFMLKGGMAGV